jgi:membrane complex biogenesis BtpA family protein
MKDSVRMERDARSDCSSLFQGSVIGMVHLLPLPGVPGHPGMNRVMEAALRDTEALLEGGAKGLLIENMHDFPCVRESEMGPEVAASMTRVAAEVRRRAGEEIPLGIQVLFAANRVAMAVAAAAELDFIRAEGWSYGHLADKGWVEASAGVIVRYRKELEAEGILVLADIKKKHASHAVTADLSIEDVAANLEIQQADAAVVTGPTTGLPPDPEDLRAVRRATTLPVVVGSGVTEENVSTYSQLADALIVGSALKEGGSWRGAVAVPQVKKLVAAAKSRARSS